MKQFTSISLAVGLVWVGCSDEGTTPLPVSEPYPEGGEEVGALPEEEGMMPESSKEGVEKLADSNAVPVLAERDGKFYQVYEIAKIPYTGKVVLYHPDGTTEASERVYIDGVRVRHTEWHANAIKKMEAVLHANGAVKTTHFDEEGNPMKAPIRIGTAPGRGLEWKTGAGAASIEILYRGKEAELIKKAFGDPDEDQNGVWVYKGMKVTAVQTGQLMTTVRFSIVDGRVLSVSVEP